MMSLFSKFLNLFKKNPKLSTEQIEALMDKHQPILERLADEMDYDGMGDYGRFPPIEKQKEIIGDDYPTYEQLIKEHESQNPK
jgi:hypothetical protein